MAIHFIKGVELVAALLAPVVCTLFYHWQIRIARRTPDRVR